MLAGSWYREGAGKEEKNSNEASCVVALHLDAETSLAPVPSLSVVTAGSCSSVHTFIITTRNSPSLYKAPLRPRTMRGSWCAAGRKFNRTGWCCPFGGESIGEWDDSASSPWRASASCGKTCGSVARKVGHVSLHVLAIDTVPNCQSPLESLVIPPHRSR